MSALYLSLPINILYLTHMMLLLTFYAHTICSYLPTTPSIYYITFYPFALSLVAPIDFLLPFYYYYCSAATTNDQLHTEGIKRNKKQIRLVEITIWYDVKRLHC